jgi:uncharacterized protein
MKRLSLILTVLLMLAALCAPALASSLPLVVDDVSLLTPSEVTELTAEAQRLSEEYKLDVVILTTGSLEGKTALNFAADYYDSKGYGQGDAHDGVMLTLSMEDRDWCILTTGSGIQTFTDYGIEVISDDIVPYFSDGDYAGGFKRFLHDAEIFLAQDAKGEPYDIHNTVQLRSPFDRTVGAWLYLLLGALVAAAIGLGILMIGMKTAKPQYSAAHYVKDGSTQIARMQDLYLYHTQTRVRVQKESSGGGGGSSTFTSSSGTSHGGGGGKF